MAIYSKLYLSTMMNDDGGEKTELREPVHGFLLIGVISYDTPPRVVRSRLATRRRRGWKSGSRVKKTQQPAGCLFMVW